MARSSVTRRTPGVTDPSGVRTCASTVTCLVIISTERPARSTAWPLDALRLLSASSRCDSLSGLRCSAPLSATVNAWTLPSVRGLNVTVAMPFNAVLSSALEASKNRVNTCSSGVAAQAVARHSAPARHPAWRLATIPRLSRQGARSTPRDLLLRCRSDARLVWRGRCSGWCSTPCAESCPAG